MKDVVDVYIFSLTSCYYCHCQFNVTKDVVTVIIFSLTSQRTWILLLLEVERREGRGWRCYVVGNLALDLFAIVVDILFLLE